MGCTRRIDRFQRILVLALSGVQLSCGGNGTEPGSSNTDTSSPTESNQAPTASITAPSNGAVFLDTEGVTFRGTATDSEDGTLTGQSLVWSGSLDGAIGTGSPFIAGALTLSVGTHTITLTATDDDGASATPSISITVNQDLTAGSISGRVFRSQEDAPFAVVRVTRSGPDGNTEVVTDVLGNYEFSDVPVGTHSVSVMSEDLPPFGSFVVSGEQQVTITGGLVAEGVDFGFRVAEVEVRTMASVSSAGVGAEVEITVELDLTEIPLPMSGINGTIEWPTAVTGVVSGNTTEGDVWNQTGGSFLTNESPPGTLLFVGVSPSTGIVDDVFTMMTFRVTTVAAGSANFTPNLVELNVFDPDTGASTPLLDIVILRTTTATVTVQ